MIRFNLIGSHDIQSVHGLKKKILFSWKITKKRYRRNLLGSNSKLYCGGLFFTFTSSFRDVTRSNLTKCTSGEVRYYDDAACVLRTMFLEARAPHLSSKLPPCLPWSRCDQPKEGDEATGITRQGSTVLTGTFGQSEELRCVIAVLRQ